MYANTTCESVQKYSFVMRISSSLWSELAIFTDSTAAVNSNRGMVGRFGGATLDLDITNLMDMFPAVLISRMYDAWPYASQDASEKWCNDESTIWPNPLGWKHRSTITFSNSLISFFHCSHC